MRVNHLGSLILLGVLALPACHDSEAPAKSAIDVPPPPPTPPAPQPSDMASTNKPETQTATTMDTKPAAPKLSDAEIAAVEAAANQGEIAMAQLATKTTKNAQVKSFATMMVKDHTEADTKAKKIAQTAKMTPAENEVSSKVKSDGEATMTSLKSQKGAEFDRAYMDAQVKVHTDVLATIDDRLLPNVQNAELKAHLQEVRGHVQHHLEKAKEINQALPAAK